MKKHRKYIFICAVAAFMLFGATAVNAATVKESEPNETVKTATQINVGDWYDGELGSYALYRQRGYSDDVDYIKVNLNAGKCYYIQMKNYFDYFRDTSVIIDIISPTGEREGVYWQFIHDPKTNIDEYFYCASTTGTYYLNPVRTTG